MRAHLAYLIYVLRHKWHGLCRLPKARRVPLHQAIVHDRVKFLPIEWPAHVRQFPQPRWHRRARARRQRSHDPNKQADAFAARLAAPPAPAAPLVVRGAVVGDRQAVNGSCCLIGRKVPGDSIWSPTRWSTAGDQRPGLTTAHAPPYPVADPDTARSTARL